MNILAINTSFNQSYVAVKTSDCNVLKQMDSSLKQSENILGLIDTALTEAKTDVSKLNAIACVIGPGSFTGIRIGASLVKGICSALTNIKKIEICSLDLIAHQFINSTSVTEDFWVATNALSGNIFACKYNKDGDRKLEPFLANGDNLEQITGIVVGISEENMDICNCNVDFTSDVLLQYAQILYNQGRFSSDFVPVYLRKSQAEAELDKKQGSF